MLWGFWEMDRFLWVDNIIIDNIYLKSLLVNIENISRIAIYPT